MVVFIAPTKMESTMMNAAKLLPVDYFMVTFTLPRQLRPLTEFRRRRKLTCRASVQTAWWKTRPDVQAVRQRSISLLVGDDKAFDVLCYRIVAQNLYPLG